jgi:hypothetical protein
MATVQKEMTMRCMLLTAAILIAGCADSPGTKVAATSAAPAVSTDAAVSGAPATTDPEAVAQARRDKWAGLNGYKIIKRDGVTKYCKTWTETASRIRTQTRCLTADEIERQELQNLRDNSAPAIGQASPLASH